VAAFDQELETFKSIATPETIERFMVLQSKARQLKKSKAIKAIARWPKKDSDLFCSFIRFSPKMKMFTDQMIAREVMTKENMAVFLFRLLHFEPAANQLSEIQAVVDFCIENHVKMELDVYKFVELWNKDGGPIRAKLPIDAFKGFMAELMNATRDQVCPDIASTLSSYVWGC
jgi:hypothetical protein